MEISVIIPAHNEETSIGKCLRSIRENDFKGEYEIIVVDSCSQDKTVEIAKKYADKVIVKKTSGPGAARNIGVKESNGDIVAFTDADTMVEKNWLSIIARDFSDPEVVGVGGILKPLDPRLIDKIMFKINSDLWYRFTAKFGFYQLGTPNCAYRKEAFLKVGGFNEKLSMLEDTELSIRIAKARLGKLLIDKDLVVYNSTRRFRQEGYFKVFLRYVKAYYELFTKGTVTPKHFDTIVHE